MTKRWLSAIRENLGEFFFRQTSRRGPFRDAVAEAVEFGKTLGAQTVIFLSRKQNRYISVLTPNDDWFALSSIQQRREALLGIGN
jgi:hypothetical protein